MTVARAAMGAVLAAAIAAGGSPAPEAARAQDAATVVVAVRPAVRGVPVVLHGVRHVTDAAGNVALPATLEEAADGGALLRRLIRIVPAQLGPALRVRFNRWVGRTATVVLLRPVRIDLVDPGGRPMEPRVAPRVVVRGTDGSELALRSGRVSWLPATQGVWRPRSGWRERRVSYAINEVRTHGTNVVRRGQQRFAPENRRHVTVRVLFFSARFTARDALFGSPAGRAVVVRFPDGHSERHTFGRGGQLRLDGLPRGDYVVTAEGPGMSFSVPVSLSRPQEIDLRVITWLDVAVVMTLLLLVAVGLAVARRPALRPSLRRRRSPPAEGADHG